MQKSYNATTPKVVGSAVISTIVLVAIYTLIVQPNKDQNDNDAVPNSSVVDTISTNSTPLKTTEEAASEESQLPAVANTQQLSDAESVASLYNDGTYKAAVSYVVPKGHSNSLSVTLTITNDIISAISSESETEDQESSRYISRFEAALETAVVDESVDEISVGRIGGASLTSEAFESVLADIIATARK